MLRLHWRRTHLLPALRHGLLKDGATLVTEAGDILDAIRPLAGKTLPPDLSAQEPPDFDDAPPPAETDRARIIEALGPTPVSVDELIRHTGLHPAKVFMILLELDRLVPPDAHRNPHVRARAAKEVTALLSPVKDTVLRYSYGRIAADRLGLPAHLLLQRLGVGPKPLAEAFAAPAEGAGPSPGRRAEEALLR